jgi:hypothetical protein
MAWYVWDNVKKGIDPIEAHLRRLPPPKDKEPEPPLAET